MQAFESTSMSASAVRVAPLLPITLFVTAITSQPASAASMTAREPAPSVPMTRTSQVSSTVSTAIGDPFQVPISMSSRGVTVSSWGAPSRTTRFSSETNVPSCWSIQPGSMVKVIRSRKVVLS